jgi:hypothetical protein
MDAISGPVRGIVFTPDSESAFFRAVSVLAVNELMFEGLFTCRGRKSVLRDSAWLENVNVKKHRIKTDNDIDCFRVWKNVFFL